MSTRWCAAHRVQKSSDRSAVRGNSPGSPSIATFSRIKSINALTLMAAGGALRCRENGRVYQSDCRKDRECVGFGVESVEFCFDRETEGCGGLVGSRRFGLEEIWWGASSVSGGRRDGQPHPHHRVAWSVRHHGGASWELSSLTRTTTPLYFNTLYPRLGHLYFRILPQATTNKSYTQRRNGRYRLSKSNNRVLHAVQVEPP